MLITDYILQAIHENENAALHRRSDDVCMRIFESSDGYRKIILKVIEYMEWHLNCIFEDYPTIRSVSAAVMAIPWNIIAYKDPSDITRVCINPRLVGKDNSSFKGQTKCPCISMTTENLSAHRFFNIDLEFYDLNGHKVIQSGICRQDGAYVIQHELDHNLGICPGDNEKKGAKGG